MSDSASAPCFCFSFAFSQDGAAAAASILDPVTEERERLQQALKHAHSFLSCPDNLCLLIIGRKSIEAQAQLMRGMLGMVAPLES